MNDKKLIKNCQNGDKQAFNELITLFYPYVSKFLLKLTKEENISEDLVQETFMKLIQNIERFDLSGKATFSTYLMTIAKNCYWDYLRKNHHIMLNIDELEIMDSDFVDELVIKDMEIEEVMKEITNLSWEQAQAIRLKYIEQLTLQEIADICNTQPKTIKSRIHEGIKKIRKNLNRGGT